MEPLNLSEAEIQDQVLQYVVDKPGASFVNIEELFDSLGYDYKGDQLIYTGERNENVIVWAGWKAEAWDIVNELLKEGKIKPEQVPVWVYFVDGKALSFPIVKGNYKYKKEHWLPVTFSPVKQ